MAARAASTERRVQGSFSSQAYDKLKRRILDNEMTAGFQATELELTRMLGMSRTPVREAMIRLANEGLVEIRPRHGMRVLPVSAEDMQEIYEILTGLEATAAESVARRGLSTEELELLQRSVLDMDVALESGTLTDWAEADERFHKLLVELCGNRRLKALVETFWDQAHRVRLITLRLRPKPTQSNEDHHAVVEAIVQGDPVAARRLHREHRVRSGETLVGILKSFGLTQL